MSEENTTYDDDAFFNSVIAERTSGEPRPEPEPEPEEDNEPEQESEQPEPEAKAEPKSEDVDWHAKYRELEHRWKSDEGRVSAYQRQIDELNAKIKSVPRPEIESLQQLKSDYPDIAKAMEEMTQAQINEIKQEFESRLTPLQQMQAEQAEALRAKQFQDSVASLSAQHPDWQKYDRGEQQRIRQLAR